MSLKDYEKREKKEFKLFERSNLSHTSTTRSLCVVCTGSYKGNVSRLCRLLLYIKVILVDYVAFRFILR